MNDEISEEAFSIAFLISGSFAFASNGSLTSTNPDIIKDNQNKKLEKIVDILGRETKPIKNTLLFYIYDNGTVEKIFIR